MPSAAGERQRRLGAVLGGQRGHARVIDVRRVAQDKVVASRQLLEQVRRDQRDALAEAMAIDVEPCDRQRVGRHVGRVDRDLRIRHRRDHREAAVAGAEVERALRPLRQPCVQRAGLLGVDEQLRDVRARHDRALVDRERDVEQPGLAGEVGRGLATVDAPGEERVDLRLLVGADRALALRLERIERQAERPGDEPGGLVEGVAGAVAERHAGLLEPLGRGDDELDQGHRVSCSRVER